MEDQLSNLAAALGELHRAPGNSTAWLQRVIRSLERDRPDSHDSLRRRLGFGRKLADLAHLPERDAAVVTLGLLFHVVLDRPSSEPLPKPRRNWLAYLGREAWLYPSLQLADALICGEMSESFASAFGRAVVTVDTAAHGRRLKSLQIIQSIKEDAESAGEMQIADLLATEGGQELCGLHVRTLGDQYVLDPDQVEAAAKLLQKGDAPSSKPGVKPVIRARKSRPDPEEAWADLERRKKGLQAASSDNQERTQQTASDLPATPEQAQDRPADREESQDLELFSMVKSGKSRELEVQAAPAEPQEAPMQNRRPSSADPSDDVERAFEDLRRRLFQIGQATAEAQELLDTLAPQLEELSAWMSDLDTIVERWRGRGAKAA